MRSHVSLHGSESQTAGCCYLVRVIHSADKALIHRGDNNEIYTVGEEFRYCSAGPRFSKLFVYCFAIAASSVHFAWYMAVGSTLLSSAKDSKSLYLRIFPPEYDPFEA